MTLILVIKTGKYLQVVFLHYGPTTEAWKAGGERKHIIRRHWFNERKWWYTELLLYARPWAWMSVKLQPLFGKWVWPWSSCHGGRKRIREVESVIQLVSSGAGMRTKVSWLQICILYPVHTLTGFQIPLPRIYQDSTLGLFSSVTELSQAFLHNAKFELKGHGTDEDTEASSR